MSETADNLVPQEASDQETAAVTPQGPVSQFLTENDFDHEALGTDHKGVEMIRLEREFWPVLATVLYGYGFNYLQCQAGYDMGPGQPLVSVYHLIKLDETNTAPPQELRVKILVPREDPRVPSVYWIWKSADWQERETYDMYGIIYEGHPNLKRILMPEDWVGWPMRKDYITPDFYELQDAY